MAGPHHGVWGIDIGQAALKALRLETIDGVVTATAFDYVEHPKILSQPDADPDQLTREALEQFLSRNNLKGDHVAISVPGQSGLARFVKLPPVEEKKIGDIVKFEAKQQIPFPLEEVVWDYQKIGSGEVTDGFAMETEIGLFAMKRDQINRTLAHFQDVGIEVHTIQMAPLALCNYVAFDLLNKGGSPAVETPPPGDDAARGKRKCVVGLDVGTDSSNLIITDGEKIIWQRPIPLGGNHLTRALSKELKLTFAKAEHMKRNAAKSPPELKQILAALKPVLGDFVGEVQRSLGFFTNSHRDSQVQYMVGLGSAFRLPGLQKYLAEKLQLEVKKPNSFNRLVGDDVVNAPVFVENLLGFAVPYGLAVQGLAVSKLRTNLLPSEIQFDRMIRAKKPWAVAAASALFLGTAMLAGGYAINYNAVAAKSIKEEMKKAETKIAAANKQNSDATAKDAEIAKLQAEVKSVVAGKDEQLDLIRLNEYINQCLPTPETPDPKSPNGFRYDGGNLTSHTKTQDNPVPRVVDQRVYWNTKEATDAWREYRDRVRGGQLADAPIDETVRENLVLIDLESVDARYSDNLKNFFDAAKTQSEKVGGTALRGMLKEDFDNPPKDGDKGWVVELRGTTYHKQSVNFLVDSLVHNLTWKARKAATPAAGDAAPTPPAPDAAAGDGAPKKIDPVDGLVSHVFVYAYEPDLDPKPGTFVRFGTSVLPSLVTSAAAATGDVGVPTGPGPGMGSGSGGRDSWQPITSSSGPGGAGGPGAGGFTGGVGRGGPGGEMPTGRPGPRGGERGSGPSGGAPGPFGGVPIPGGPQAPVPPGTVVKKPKPRYEFIVMFIWREPTPSDALMKLDQPQQ